MHKNIALLIEKIVTESPYKDFEAVILPQKGNGFWGINLRIKERGLAHTEALVKSLRLIGLVYGEGLAITDKGNVVEVN